MVAVLSPESVRMSDVALPGDREPHPRVRSPEGRRCLLEKRLIYHDLRRGAWMIRACLFSCLWILLPFVALAGPNEGGALIIHANPMLTYTTGQDFCGESGLTHCLVSQDSLPYEPEVARVWFVLASFNPSAQPRLKAVSFGVDYDSTRLAILASGSCADFEIPDGRWPAPGTGVGQSWTECRTSELAECYWFAGYTYDAPGSPDTTSFAVVPHPRHGAVFVDDSMPPQEDTVQDLGRLGFGQPGALVCFRVPSPPQPEMEPCGIGELELPTPQEQAAHDPGKYWYRGHEVSVTWEQLASPEAFDQLWEIRSGTVEDTLLFAGYPHRLYRNARYYDPLRGISPEDLADYALLEQAADSVRGEPIPERQAERYLAVLQALDPEDRFVLRTWRDGAVVVVSLRDAVELQWKFRGGNATGVPNFAPRIAPAQRRNTAEVKAALRGLLVRRGWLIQQEPGSESWVSTSPAGGLQVVVSAMAEGQTLEVLVNC